MQISHVDAETQRLLYAHAGVHPVQHNAVESTATLLLVYPVPPSIIPNVNVLLYCSATIYCWVANANTTAGVSTVPCEPAQLVYNVPACDIAQTVLGSSATQTVCGTNHLIAMASFLLSFHDQPRLCCLRRGELARLSTAYRCESGNPELLQQLYTGDYVPKRGCMVRMGFSRRGRVVLARPTPGLYLLLCWVLCAGCVYSVWSSFVMLQN